MSGDKILKLKDLNQDLKQPPNNLRLALDIGTNSIGWALYNLDKNNSPKEITEAGVRIFPSGRNSKDYTTLNATRRQARLQRRQRDRYLQRRAYLLHLLKKYGLFPEDQCSLKELQNLNPYEIRTKGLDEKLNIYHFGRALFHLNQRRGFKSNRKSGSGKEDGIIAKSVENSEEQLEKCGARTYGEFLWKRFQKMEESRKHPGSQQEHWILARKPIGAGAKENYVVYAQRSMIENEFNKLWDSQSQYYDKLKDQKLKALFHKAIFHQRQLKKSIVGKCYFLPSEKRISRALPSFQKFRILKELNNLSYINMMGESVLLKDMDKGIEFRNYVIEKLFQKKNKVTFSSLEKEFKNFFSDVEDFSRFNLDINDRNYLEGEQTSIVLTNLIPDWQSWSLDIQDQFIELLEGESQEDIFIKKDEEVLKDLQKFSRENNLNISDQILDNVLENMNDLPQDHGKYSRKVIHKIIPFLEKGELEIEAIKLAGWHHSDRRHKGELLDKLPLYQQVLGDHCVEMKLSETAESKHNKFESFRIPNPTVHIAFNQLRLLVNDILRVYGKPMEVVIETARDLPMGSETKKKSDKKINDNKKRNEDAKKFIDEFGGINNKTNRVRYKLWKEQNNTCVYSGKKIPETKLLSPELEVDHILPYSKTLDDGFMNKVLVYKVFNQQKGNQTPYEAFSSDKVRWAGILQRVNELSEQKRWKFNKDAMKKFEENGNFLERQLNDTRYISKYAIQYLGRVCKDVWSVKGQTTFLLRSLLQYDKKNRNDHRHHAKDALVIGLVDRSLVQQISNIAKGIEGKSKERLENIGRVITQDVIPWPSFKEDAKRVIDQIIVSHRRRTKKAGQLHNDTAYGVLGSVNTFSKPINVIHYVEILTLNGADKKKIESRIISEKVKQDFLKELKVNNTLSKEFLINYHQKTGIRRVRLNRKERVIPIENKFGKIYKFFQEDGNYAIQLFKNSSGKWDAQVISIFSANQKTFKPIPDKARLMKGDMLFFAGRFWRLVKFTQNKNLTFSEHFEANVDARNRSRSDQYKYTQKSPSSLQKCNPKRVNISPCGLVQLTDFIVGKEESKRHSA